MQIETSDLRVLKLSFFLQSTTDGRRQSYLEGSAADG